MNQTRQRTDAEFELVDLADYPLPHDGAGADNLIRAAQAACSY
jgi:hypothetical protein